MKKLGSSHKDMDTDIGCVVGCVNVHTTFYKVFPWWSNDYCLGVPFGSPPLLLHLLGILECLLELL